MYNSYEYVYVYHYIYTICVIFIGLFTLFIWVIYWWRLTDQENKIIFKQMESSY